MIDLLVRFITVGHAHAASFNLAIPGNIDTSATPSPAGFIANFYQFGMVLAGILAFVVIVYAGVKYAISRGNPTQQGDATDRLTQAFLGILLLVGAYIILFVLNPGLTKLELPRLVQIDRSQTAEPVQTFEGGIPAPLQGDLVSDKTDGRLPPSGNGKCTPISIQGNPCATQNLQQSCWGSLADTASRVCNAESGGGKPNIYNKSLQCGSGNYIIYGLFQINLNANDLVVPCGQYPTAVKTASGGCLLRCSAAVGGPNKNCSIDQPDVYKDCVKAVKVPEVNIATACEVYKTQKWGAWEVTHPGFACSMIK
jgi:hypothetical protein